MNKRFLIILLLVFIGCTTTSNQKGYLGQTDYRKVVILGEQINDNIALYYTNKYNAICWYSRSKGFIVDAVKKTVDIPMPMSLSMRDLIIELKGLNNSDGKWELIVPDIAEDYFLSTLKFMKTNSVSNASGIIYLVDSDKNENIEKEVRRVTDGKFIVINDKKIAGFNG